MAHMAAADGALRQLFEKPLPENPTLLEVLAACDHMHHKKQLPPVDPASFTEIFGELHFQEKPDAAAAAARFVLPPVPHPPPAAPAARGTASWLDVAEVEKSKDDSSLDALLRPKPAGAAGAGAGVRRSASFCLKKSSASLLLCTEGLGSESTVDADDMVKDSDDAAAAAALRGAKEVAEEAAAERTRSDAADAANGKEPPSFPPPIRSIGRGGRPCVCFRSFREEGRFVLTQVVIPGKELLHASREGGRLRLQFANAATGVGPDDDDGGEEPDLLGDREGNSTCQTCA